MKTSSRANRVWGGLVFSIVCPAKVMICRSRWPGGRAGRGSGRRAARLRCACYGQVRADRAGRLGSGHGPDLQLLTA